MLVEASSIMKLLSSSQVEETPELQGPTGCYRSPVPFVDSEVAVSTLIVALSNPGPNFPRIHALASGQVICNVHYLWVGVQFIVQVLKR